MYCMNKRSHSSITISINSMLPTFQVYSVFTNQVKWGHCVPLQTSDVKTEVL